MVTKRKPTEDELSAAATADNSTHAPVWGGGFTTDSASGAAPAPESGTATPPDTPETAVEESPQTGAGEGATIPAEATEAAKVKRSRKRKAESQVPPAEKPSESASLNTSELVRYVERIERLAEELSTLKQDIKEVFSEVKGQGYQVSILRKVLARRAMDDEKRKEQDAMIALYEEALR